MRTNSFKKRRLIHIVGSLIALTIITISLLLLILPTIFQFNTLSDSSITFKDVLNLEGLKQTALNTTFFAISIPIFTIFLGLILAFSFSMVMPTRWLKNSLVGYLRWEHFIFSSIITTSLSLLINNGAIEISHSKWVVIITLTIINTPGAMVLFVPIMSKNIIIHRVRAKRFSADSIVLILKNALNRSWKAIALALTINCISILFMNPIFIYGSKSNVFMSHNETIFFEILNFTARGNYIVASWMSLLLLIPSVILSVISIILIFKINKDRREYIDYKKMGKEHNKFLILIIAIPYIAFIIFGLFVSYWKANTEIPNSVHINNWVLDKDQSKGIITSLWTGVVISVIICTFYLLNAFFAIYFNVWLSKVAFIIMLLISTINSNVLLIGRFLMFTDHTTIKDGRFIIILSSLSMPMSYVWIHTNTTIAYETKSRIFKYSEYGFSLQFITFIKDSKLILKYMFILISSFNAYYLNHLISIAYSTHTFSTEMLRIVDENGILDINKRIAFNLTANLIVISPLSIVVLFKTTKKGIKKWNTWKKLPQLAQ